jgi:hypothetical protein
MKKALALPISMAFTCALFLMLLHSGCVVTENYGKLAMQQGGSRLTPEDLAQTWDRYNVYYAGYSPENPFAMIFDPKGDDKILHVHRFWDPVKDEKTLREAMKWLGVRKERDPYIYRILSPKGDFYGYMYTGLSHVTIKVISDHTLFVDKITMSADYTPGAWDASVGR